ncbi:hypothetical protein ACM41_03165 [Bradyrhizobium sp. CCBAU 21362]|nr:hypothetical protein [Bradyrhizobium sp. CCBAU 21362]
MHFKCAHNRIFDQTDNAYSAQLVQDTMLAGNAVFLLKRDVFLDCELQKRTLRTISSIKHSVAAAAAFGL